MTHSNASAAKQLRVSEPNESTNFGQLLCLAHLSHGFHWGRLPSSVLWFQGSVCPCKNISGCLTTVSINQAAAFEIECALLVALHGLVPFPCLVNITLSGSVV